MNQRENIGKQNANEQKEGETTKVETSKEKNLEELGEELIASIEKNKQKILENQTSSKETGERLDEARGRLGLSSPVSEAPSIANQKEQLNDLLAEQKRLDAKKSLLENIKQEEIHSGNIYLDGGEVAPLSKIKESISSDPALQERLKTLVRTGKIFKFRGAKSSIEALLNNGVIRAEEAIVGANGDDLLNVPHSVFEKIKNDPSLEQLRRGILRDLENVNKNIKDNLQELRSSTTESQKSAIYAEILRNVSIFKKMREASGNYAEVQGPIEKLASEAAKRLSSGGEYYYERLNLVLKTNTIESLADSKLLNKDQIGEMIESRIRMHKAKERQPASLKAGLNDIRGALVKASQLGMFTKRELLETMGTAI